MTLRLWKIEQWVSFWFTHALYKQIRIDEISLMVRGNAFSSKLTDVYVALENLVKNRYLLEHRSLGKDAVVIDIGAHIGTFSIYAAHHNPSWRIYSFEPFKESYDLFVKNIRLNNLSNIFAFNSAVAKDSGTKTLYLDALNTSAHSFTKKTSASVQVASSTLEEIFRSNTISQCDLLKIDCEGAEYEIVFNASAEILRKIKKINLEYHVPHHYGVSADRAVTDLIKYLEDNNFQVTLKKENYQRGYMYAQRKSL